MLLKYPFRDVPQEKWFYLTGAASQSNQQHSNIVYTILFSKLLFVLVVSIIILHKIILPRKINYFSIF